MFSLHLSSVVTAAAVFPGRSQPGSYQMCFPSPVRGELVDFSWQEKERCGGVLSTDTKLMSPWESIPLVWTGRWYQRINSNLTLCSLITTKTQEKNSTKKNPKNTSICHISDVIAFSQLVSLGTVADKRTSFRLQQWMAKFDVNSVIKNAEKTHRH